MRLLFVASCIQKHSNEPYRTAKMAFKSEGQEGLLLFLKFLLLPEINYGGIYFLGERD